MTARRLLTETVPVPQAIAQVLEEGGVDFVFGMPGGRTIRSTTPSTIAARLSAPSWHAKKASPPSWQLPTAASRVDPPSPWARPLSC